MDYSVEILIADDHEPFRRTLRSFIENQPNWHVCGEAGDRAEVVEKAKVLHPDVVLMDINIPRMDGLEATRILRRDLPAGKVVIVTQNRASIARQQAASVNASASSQNPTIQESGSEVSLRWMRDRVRHFKARRTSIPAGQERPYRSRFQCRVRRCGSRSETQRFFF